MYDDDLIRRVYGIVWSAGSIRQRQIEHEIYAAGDTESDTFDIRDAVYRLVETKRIRRSPRYDFSVIQAEVEQD